MSAVFPIAAQKLSANIATDLSFTPSWDLLIFLVFLGAIFLYGLSLGRDRLVTFLLSIYFSAILIYSLPWKILAGFLGDKGSPSPSSEVFLFLAAVVAIVFLMPRSLLGSKLKGGKAGRGSIIHTVILSVCGAGLLGAITLSFLSEEIVSDLNPLIIQLFWGEGVRFFWMLVPILCLILLRPGRGEARVVR